ncbi:type II toxin-antitoxin system RelE/ParE family toxin [Vandammella animalimorsus]|uniref:type II toxin-antitoxin system RelE/ParE family toxin n=1 Tax=Vandammella animalimorsus TaxID=2029117 RepID=UPI001EEE1D02|nr:type II toxin-antitoxin system RelE/ParE family toxin [Vandammella animalimorsus]
MISAEKEICQYRKSSAAANRIAARRKQHQFLCLSPSNRLKALKFDRQGQFSTRINGQWRICLKWNEVTNNADDVDSVDDH